jgi:hypothetical protein
MLLAGRAMLGALQFTCRHSASTGRTAGRGRSTISPRRAFSTAGARTRALALPTDPANATTAAVRELKTIYKELEQAFQRSGHATDCDQRRMQLEAREHVDALRPLVAGDMRLRELRSVLSALAKLRWYDHGLMQQLETRAKEAVCGLGLADLANVLVPFAQLASGPLQLLVCWPDGTQPGELIDVDRGNGQLLRVPVPYGAHLGKSLVHTAPAVLYPELVELVLERACSIQHTHKRESAFAICRLS